MTLEQLLSLSWGIVRYRELSWNVVNSSSFAHQAMAVVWCWRLCFAVLLQHEIFRSSIKSSSAWVICYFVQLKCSRFVFAMLFLFLLSTLRIVVQAPWLCWYVSCNFHRAWLAYPHTSFCIKNGHFLEFVTKSLWHFAAGCLQCLAVVT